MARRILVVDDSSDIRGMLKIFLEMEGYKVQLAKDGGDALDLISKDGSPCLILLDMIMERMDGKAFLEKLRLEHPGVFDSTPVIAMSAMESRPDVDVDGFLPKPFDMETLSQTLRLHCA